jgi:hypothetical protein
MEKAASMPLDKVFNDLKTSKNGLTSQEAKLRLKKFVYIMLGIPLPLLVVVHTSKKRTYPEIDVKLGKNRALWISKLKGNN